MTLGQKGWGKKYGAKRATVYALAAYNLDLMVRRQRAENVEGKMMTWRKGGRVLIASGMWNNKTSRVMQFC